MSWSVDARQVLCALPRAAVVPYSGGHTISLTCGDGGAALPPNRRFGTPLLRISQNRPEALQTHRYGLSCARIASVRAETERQEQTGTA